MANKITYEDKEQIEQIVDYPEKNQCTANNLNEIKNVVNSNADLMDEDIKKIKSQIPTGQVTGTEITLSDSSDLELTDFSIAVNNSAHLVVSNKNLLEFITQSGHGITYNKNRITIVNPDFYLINNNSPIFNNKFLSGKTVTFTYIINGEITGNNYIDIVFSSNKNTYRVQNPMPKGSYNNTKFTKTITLASDEYFTQCQVWTAGTTCNLTVDIQVEISNIATDLVEHEGAEFDITTDNALSIIEQIKRNGTYKNITHFYTTDETHPSINLEYYKDLETLFNNLVQTNSQESEG